MPDQLNDTVMRAVVAALKGTAYDEVMTYAAAKFIATVAVQAALSAIPDQRTVDLDELQDRLEWMTQHLAECYRQSGADTDGNEDWRLAPFAMSEVRRLRSQYNAASARVRELEAATHPDSPRVGDGDAREPDRSELLALIEQARARGPMTDEERAAQRESYVQAETAMNCPHANEDCLPECKKPEGGEGCARKAVASSPPAASVPNQRRG